MAEVDPVTLEVVRHSLHAILDEQDVNITRTAFSPLVYEIRDFCTALLDAEGNLISQGRMGIPVFLSDLGPPIRDGLEIYGRDGFAPGDAVITNYAGVCGQHLNNVVMYTPVFWEGALLAFVAVRMHWTDVGGRSIGLVSDTTEIFQEGIQLRTVKLYRRGERDEEIARIIRHNVRMPENTFGDLNAQLAACRLGEQRFLGLLRRYGGETVLACVREMWNRSERLARDAIARLPDGEYRAEAFMDDDGVDVGMTVPIRVRVVIAGSDLTVDLSEVAEQVRGPINSGASAGMAAAKIAFKFLTTPHLPADEGCFRPLHVALPPGKFISALEPAPMSQWTLPLPTVIDTILHALGEAAPDWVAGGHFGALNTYQFFGVHPRTGRRYYELDNGLGGWGATAHADGFGPLKSMVHGDTYNLPIEVEETLVPLRVRRFALRPDSGGPGRHRGGLGSVKEYELTSNGFISPGFDRSRCRPWGMAGGKPGSGSEIYFRQRPDGEAVFMNKATAVPTEPGATLLILTGGGGGHGDALERDPARVASDVRDGYVSAESARADYGVVLDPATLAVDEAATAALRAQLDLAQRTES
ncbi:MAG: hydantoinase B/oxoprolinase family protein [Chloroflexi bacterium]|nr:hydantoinase B/oxoprolinase family protein [Chloroflexota bacterium]